MRNKPPKQPAPVTEVTLTDEEKAEVRALGQNLTAIKEEAADYSLQIAVLDATRLEVLKRQQQAKVALDECAKRIAGQHPEFPTAGAWSLDVKTLTFKKTG